MDRYLKHFYILLDNVHHLNVEGWPLSDGVVTKHTIFRDRAVRALNYWRRWYREFHETKEWPVFDESRITICEQDKYIPRYLAGYLILNAPGDGIVIEAIGPRRMPT